VRTLAREAAQRQRLNKQFAGRQRPPTDADQYGSPATAEDA
jgi:hypothetical protein